MKISIKNLVFLGTLLFGLFTSEAGADELRVVTTIPDLADIAERIGGDQVSVTSLAKGTENIHAVQLRPSHLVKMNKADLFIEMGLSLEHAYVPGLLLAARNSKIEPGKPGFVNCSDGWEALDVPVRISRADAADIHPMGNPHYNLDPAGGRHIADRILEGLVRVRPESEEYFRERHAAYGRELEEAAKRWKKLAEQFAGEKVVIYHRSFSYFAKATGLEIAGELEPKPGVPPSPRDLARAIELIEREGVTLILTGRWSNNKSVRFVAEKTGVRVLEIPIMVKGVPRVDSWIGMMDFLHEKIAEHHRGE
jgi:zinc/manganese transport system substrate-binding protein